MEVAFSSSFKKSFRKKFKDAELSILFWDAVTVFIENPFHPSLKTHKLSGKLKNLFSFSVTFSFHVIFYFTSDKPPKAVFIDIGSHDEVY
jgi:mRNA-degrading endonuclease YafQ of YafQ-DinJ toxin-antitoxin module